MRTLYRALLLSFSVLFLTACFDDMDDTFAQEDDIKNFIYRGMNAFYLYKPEIPELSNGRFETISELENYHDQFESPEVFFESLLYRPLEVDQFSFITSDFRALAQELAGTRRTTGMRFVLVHYPSDPSKLFAAVRYVLPGSDAVEKGITRGLLFNRVDGQQITIDNFQQLFDDSGYRIGLANFDGNVVTELPEEISLSTSVIQENPIHEVEVFQQGNKTIGYLMYNSFNQDFDRELNQVFADFQSQGVTDLIVDLRYNGGGAVNTAIILGSLISGQPTSDVFSREEWNPGVQAFIESENPETLVNYFKSEINDGPVLNTLGLDKVTIIATRSSASASELVINALRPYMNLTHVGTSTRGKFQASITLYDSPDFRPEDINPMHTFAMQPLVLKSLNSQGVTDYINGLSPDLLIGEEYDNLGTLGDPNEPLLEAALQSITSGVQPSSLGQDTELMFTDDKSMRRLGNEMYHETLPGYLKPAF